MTPAGRRAVIALTVSLACCGARRTPTPGEPVSTDRDADRYHQLVLVQITEPDRFTEYQTRVGPLVEQYEGRLDRQIAPASVQGYGEVTAVNLVSSATRRQWAALFEDPRFEAIAHLRSESSVLGSVWGTSIRGEPGTSDPAGRLYLVELATYGPGGAEAYQAYVDLAEPIMARYGYHVEREIRIEGHDGLPFRPDVAKVAFFDTQDGMSRMEQDPAHALLEGDAYTAAAARSIWVVGSASAP